MPERILILGRRRFLTRAVPAAATICLGCRGLAAWPGQESKFAANPGMTTEEMFRFFYGLMVPTLTGLAETIGREKMVRELTRISAGNAARMIAAAAKDLPKRDMRSFQTMMDGHMATAPYSQAITYEVVERSDKAYEMKVTRCLPADMWREMKGADLGYALECSSGDAVAKAFNPRMRGIEIKNFLKGDNVCIGRYELV